MSRVGKKPVTLPSGVTADISGSTVKVKGPKGELQQEVDPTFTVALEDGGVVVTPPTGDRIHRAKHGLYRQLINNMAIGVSAGFTRVLEIEGVGYNAKLEGKNLSLSVGYNAPVVMPIPDGLEVKTPKPTTVEISGSDKQLVGQFAANVRKKRPPEPYKGKGIRYSDEVVRRKAGKAVGK